MRTHFVAVVCAALGLAGSGVPDLSAVSSDGTTYQMASLAKHACVFYFVKVGCPVNQRVIPYINRLATAYQGDTRIVAVVSGSVADAKEWKVANEARFLVLSDPGQTLIRAFRAEFSPWLVLYEPKSQRLTSIPGGSKPTLIKLNEFLAKSAQSRVLKMNFDAAPKDRGCAF